MSTIQIPCQRHLFDIPDDVAYLNCAYMGPLMHSVIEAGERGMRAKTRPWNISPGDFFPETERARRLFSELIGADAEGVAVVPSASYGLSCAGRNTRVTENGRIIVLADQFPSNVYIWRERVRTSGASLVTVERPSDNDWTRAVLREIDERAEVVALPNCHWTDGGLVDLVRVGERCREAGAMLVLDLTQSAGALPFDTAAVQPDFVVCAGYKFLLGPYSLGFLWMAPEHRDGMPIEYNWIARTNSEDFAGLVDYRDTYRPGARRFDVGENSNFILVPMLNTALEQLLEWGVENIHATLAQRNDRIAERASRLGLGVVSGKLRAAHFLGLRFPPGMLPSGIASDLAAENVHVSVRGTSMRITPHVYNTDQDIEQLFDALDRILNRHP
ncbi:MAG: aminotransferase class V-fold PLP-dependent enzyme [Gammaproteobacteria bacterium]|nr:aminotransferase class V-fold PLP-dependent enzyme [Gammaproteobacteria bacterium]MYD76417.1 aminotransferase class V-fold PLP-dependent enzyme [Gammaproteobacteria bacterium]MYJ52584.1 aminotransferase class V-fold PLP-dependent enzyme [Gammaproteobacteria bacterium]